MARFLTKLSEAASEDILLQGLWYAEHAGNDVAQRYVDALEECRVRLESNPCIGPACRFKTPLLAGLRKLSLGKGFKVHLVFYRISGNLVEIARVMHGARDLPRRLLEPPGSEN